MEAVDSPCPPPTTAAPDNEAPLLLMSFAFTRVRRSPPKQRRTCDHSDERARRVDVVTHPATDVFPAPAATGRPVLSVPVRLLHMHQGVVALCARSTTDRSRLCVCCMQTRCCCCSGRAWSPHRTEGWAMTSSIADCGDRVRDDSRVVDTRVASLTTTRAVVEAAEAGVSSMRKPRKR